MAQFFTIGAFAIIFDAQQRVLLCHRRDMDIWNLPGGGLESGELPTETAIRETLEETGLQINIQRLVGIYGKPDDNDLVFAFLAQIAGGRITLSDEADQIAYFAIDKIPENTSPRQVERIHDALKSQEHPFFRLQTAPSSRAWLQMLNYKNRENHGI